ncbi:unnamed protein product [Polarella glacialis]|uniref:Uncharacterized protein n=1 Tax=Polarella glacialis TaxID=89957 RepID=A0A813DXJ3_POLGL|nr:unnamed protein product [Polarella glacialis]
MLHVCAQLKGLVMEFTGVSRFGRCPQNELAILLADRRFSPANASLWRHAVDSLPFVSSDLGSRPSSELQAMVVSLLPTLLSPAAVLRRGQSLTFAQHFQHCSLKSPVSIHSSAWLTTKRIAGAAGYILPHNRFRFQRSASMARV